MEGDATGGVGRHGEEVRCVCVCGERGVRELHFTFALEFWNDVEFQLKS